MKKQSKTESLQECQNCAITISTRDVDNHKSVCGKSRKEYDHSFIDSYELNAKLTTGDVENEKVIYATPVIMRHCKFRIGRPVLVNNKFLCNIWNKNSLPTLTSVQVHSKFAYKFQIKKDMISLRSYSQHIPLAGKIYWTLNKENTNTNKDWFDGVSSFLKITLYDEYVNKDLSMNLMYLGVPLSVCIKDIRGLRIFQNLSLEDEKYYRVCSDTVFINETIRKTEKEHSTDLSFEDIGGLADVKDKLVEFGKLLEKQHTSILPSGILLHGPSGTGKTLIAKAFLRHLQSKDIYKVQFSSGDILSKYQGESESKVKAYFNEARTNSPSVILIDDINVICAKKESENVLKRIVSVLVTEMDSITTTSSPVLVIATSNKTDEIDISLRRAGRLEYEIEIPVPNERDRKEILQGLLSKIKDYEEFDIEEISKRAHGYVGSDLVAVIKDARFSALKSNRKLKKEDIVFSLNLIKPSAIREIIVSVPDTRWSDIGGQDTLKLKLKQAVEWPITRREAFQKLGIKPPRGLLMFGPPGCSKTLTAKALANETNLNFLAVKGPELLSKWVGESERAVRQLFQKARQAAPAIVFFDEIDAIGSKRSSEGSSSSTDVSDRVLAQLLTEIDGVTNLDNVTIVAATNRPDRIDPALLRPGRIDRLIYVPLPDSETRLKILQIHCSKTRVSEDIDLTEIVAKTEGYSGAELEAIIREAALLAIGDNSQQITKNHLEMSLKIVTPRTDMKMINFYDKFALKTSLSK
ncbi:unnamed protein product [Dimorphilus gyrociliatus]|uniref:AAA+ ATPase domain-containing protein n=1 Tax=Dimorphilus gyrociliatus TaxID=2664684 RepID=A0A7I8VL56_9ANNE|nr:unnamed protein product [Dimorphilus gyrociliatus]